MGLCLGMVGSLLAPVPRVLAEPDRTAAPSLAQTDDDPDLPDFLQGIDRGQYLAAREQHIAELRGVEPGKPFDVSLRVKALQQRFQQQAAAGSAAPSSSTLSTSTWTPIGPAPLPNGQTDSRTDPVSGRVTAIAVHPTNPNIAYVGAAQGGVFRTLDGGTTWTALMDNAATLAIGAITIDPLNPSTVFVGSGEGNLSGDSFFGLGLYRITNADGVSPTVSGPFETRVAGAGTTAGNGHAFVGTSITSIAVDPTNDNRIFIGNIDGTAGIGGGGICCGGSNPPSGVLGLWISETAQAGSPTFSLVSGAPASGLSGVTDIAFEPGSSNNLLIGVRDRSTSLVGTTGVYRTTNASATSVAGSTSATFTRTLTPSISSNVKLAIDKVGSTVTALAGTEESSGTLRKSTDGGATFSTPLSSATGFCDGQCWYDLPIAIDPGNANNMYLGGNVRGATTRLFAKSTDGTNFTNSSTGLHADAHAIAIAPSNSSIIYFGSDGGVWKSTDAGLDWTSLNNSGLSTLQFMSVAAHPTDATFTIGGTQDNGTPLRMADGTWTRADFGDGGFSAIDQTATDTTNVTMYHTYFNQTNNLLGFARVDTVANAQDGGWSFFGCSGNVSHNGITCSDSVLFYAPIAVGPGSPNTIYYGSDRLYRSTDKGVTNTVVSQAPITTSTPISAIGISPQNDNVRIVGLRNGHVWATTTGSSTLTDVTPPVSPLKYIARAVIDPQNANTAYVTLSGYGLPAGQHVWKTTNLNGAPPTWTAAGNGIPDVPVDSFVVDPTNSNKLYAGTDIGVYASTDGGATWAPFGSGLPAAAVFGLTIQNSGRVLRAATHGRGMWEISLSTSSPVVVLLSSPARLVDTRSAGGPITSGSSRCFPVAGQAGIPADAGAVVLNVTAVSQTTPGWLTAYPNGQPVPSTSTLNFGTSQYAIANGAIVRVGDSGQVCVNVGTINSAPGSSQVILDATGYLPSTALSQLAMLAAPQRLVDTRNAGGPIATGSSRCFPVAGQAGIPADAAAVVLNVTAVDYATQGWVTAYPGGQSAPTTSTVNFDTSEYAIANNALMRIGSNGQVCVQVGTINSAPGSADVILDATGYLTASGLAQLSMLAAPQRAVDTRSSGGPIATGTTRCFTIAGQAGVPATAAGVLVNVTAVGYGTPGWVTAYPGGQSVPTTSTLNFDTSEYAMANGAIISLANGGQLCVSVGTVNSAPGSSQVILDITGYLPGP